MGWHDGWMVGLAVSLKKKEYQKDVLVIDVKSFWFFSV